MKLCGGYGFKIAGRPVQEVSDVPVPETIEIDLQQSGLVYHAAVMDGSTVAFGEPLAWADLPGGKTALPAPVSGTVTFQKARKGLCAKYIIQVTDPQPAPAFESIAPEQANAGTIRSRLAESGIWPLLHSSASNGIPPMDGPAPKRILVVCLKTEPFRANGQTVFQQYRTRFLDGLRYLPQLLDQDGMIHLVVSGRKDPFIQDLCRETGPQSQIRIETIPDRYPAEDPQVLSAGLRRQYQQIGSEEDIWALDDQALAALGACMADGLPLHERMVALGGPAMSQPRHVRVRIGTPLDKLIVPVDRDDEVLILRGGLMKGVPVKTSEAVFCNDDAFFALPRTHQKEFLGFINPGFNRVSILPCFFSWLTGASDSHVSASLRGERRACIACGLCEEVCPVGLLPQVLHRYLYRDALDEAERTGLERCIGCGLCSYVCPSKIELRHQFSEAKTRLEKETSETQEASHANHLNPTGDVK